MIKLFDMKIRQSGDILIEGTGKGNLLISPTGRGQFFGERLRGRVLPVGACTTYTPASGINIIHAPFLLETDDDAKLFMQINAYLHLKQNLEDAILDGKLVSPEQYYYKGSVRFDVGSLNYKWLEDRIFVCEGSIDSWEILRFVVYEI